jgi:GntR family transcriptional regulator of abcA and norABC
MSNVFNVGSQSAWVVAPDAIVERLTDVKLQLYGATLHIMELMAWRMLAAGTYANTMERIRKLLPARVEAFDGILHKHLDGIASWNKKNILYHTWVEFYQGIDTDKIFLDCTDVFFNPGSIFNDKTRSHLLLSTNAESLENVDLGLSRIAYCAKKQLA